ncbi:hypothetical protein C8R47DRAFT_1282461 [Mycena vitilis]|nr:hypothetical protein C8R47DRAFT_1282461 [Mycena vitilis]
MYVCIRVSICRSTLPDTSVPFSHLSLLKRIVEARVICGAQVPCDTLPGSEDLVSYTDFQVPTRNLVLNPVSRPSRSSAPTFQEFGGSEITPAYLPGLSAARCGFGDEPRLARKAESRPEDQLDCEESHCARNGGGGGGGATALEPTVHEPARDIGTSMQPLDNSLDGRYRPSGLGIAAAEYTSPPIACSTTDTRASTSRPNTASAPAVARISRTQRHIPPPPNPTRTRAVTRSPRAAFAVPSSSMQQLPALRRSCCHPAPYRFPACDPARRSHRPQGTGGELTPPEPHVLIHAVRLPRHAHPHLPHIRIPVRVAPRCESPILSGVCEGTVGRPTPPKPHASRATRTHTRSPPSPTRASASPSHPYSRPRCAALRIADLVWQTWRPWKVARSAKWKEKRAIQEGGIRRGEWDDGEGENGGEGEGTCRKKGDGGIKTDEEEHGSGSGRGRRKVERGAGGSRGEEREGKRSRCRIPPPETEEDDRFGQRASVQERRDGERQGSRGEEREGKRSRCRIPPPETEEDACRIGGTGSGGTGIEAKYEEGETGPRCSPDGGGRAGTRRVRRSEGVVSISVGGGRSTYIGSLRFLLGDAHTGSSSPRFPVYLLRCISVTSRRTRDADGELEWSVGRRIVIGASRARYRHAGWRRPTGRARESRKREIYVPMGVRTVRGRIRRKRDTPSSRNGCGTAHPAVERLVGDRPPRPCPPPSASRPPPSLPPSLIFVAPRSPFPSPPRPRSPLHNSSALRITFASSSPPHSLASSARAPEAERRRVIQVGSTRGGDGAEIGRSGDIIEVQVKGRAAGPRDPLEDGFGGWRDGGEGGMWPGARKRLAIA